MSSPKDKERRIEEPIKTEFVECDTCKAKPGSPYLCSGCLKNRQIIHALLEYVNKLKKQSHAQ